MKSKILKNIIAIMLCMVIVISGSGYLLAESLQEEGSVEVMEASVEDEPAEEKPAEKETTVEVEIPAKKETVEEKKEEEPPKEETVKEETVKEETAETPAAEEPAAETPTEESAEPILQLTYEDDDVKVIVDATKAGNIPDGATLSVTPIEKKEVTAGMSAEEKAKTKEINEQYELTEKKLQEKADKEEYDIAGFLAYDITFVDEDGNKLEPNGDVKVSMEYKNAVVPEEVKNAEAEAKANNDEYKADVTIMHLEENSNGTVKEVVDMVADANEVATVDATTSSKVKKAEFVTNSFSVFTITWTNDSKRALVNVNYGYLDENGDFVPFDKDNTSLKDLKDNNISISNKDVTNLDDYKVEFEGYTYQKTVIDNPVSGTSVKYLKRSKDYVKWSTDKDEYQEWIELKKDNSAVGNVYYVYTANSSGGGSGGSGGQQTLDAPTHSKYIKQNTLGEDYTLTLDVIGGIGEPQTVDVLMIVDQSGSMGNNISTGKTRAAAVNDAIGSFRTTLQNSDAMQNGDLKVNVAAVVFGTGDSRDTYTAMDWKELPTSVSLGFEAQGVYNQGTNWQAGIRKAENTLEQKANDGNKKVVIFLTDGLPTYRIGGGDGRTDSDGKNYNAAVTEWNASTNLKGCAQKYVIDMYGSTSSSENVCANFANAIGATRINGTNTTDLTNGFKNIANNIARPAYKNVQIVDTLSQWVEFKDADPNITLKKKDADGNEIIIARGALSSDDVSSYVTYNAENKTITADLSKVTGDAKLEDGITYSLSFDVKPTAEAQEKFIEDGGYPHIGEEDTDAEGNTTSSGQPGFYSNDNAKVYYQVNDGSQTSAEYKKPVVQIDTGMIDIPENPNPIDGSITKTMGAVREDGKYPITLEVKTRMEETSEAAKVDAILVIDVSGSMDDGNRMASTITAAQAFVRGFIGQEGTVSKFHRVGLVTFSTTASINQINGEYFSGDSEKVIDAIGNLKANGGTNTEDGFQKALDLSKRSENRKYVIFLTDGVPTRRNTTTGTNNDGSGTECSVDEYNQAVDKANELKNNVDGIYTIGLLNGMTSGSKDMDVARRLLASSNTSHQQTGYTDCYKPTATSGDISGSSAGIVNWNTSKSYTYSNGYFEITSSQDAGTKLEAIWKELATIINNSTAGSTGGGWTVTDQMADYTTFCELDGAEMNGYKLELSDDKTTLYTTIGETRVEVAQYNSLNETLTWNLNDALAEQSIKYNHGVDYTYRLTYYVDFEDSGKTEFRKTNETTYVTKKEGEGGGKLYPPKMPFFVNVIGDKLKADSDTGLEGAKFSVYRDDMKQNPIAENISSDENGHFAFQIGQSDMMLTTDEDGNESYTMTVYLEETEAPYGYVKDEKLHAITINVSDVTYAAKGSTGVQEGTPSGVASIGYTQESDDVLSIEETTGELKLAYSNIPRADWGIIKRSKSNHENYLEGAEFALYKKNELGQIDSDPSYTGTSNAYGVISTWEDATNDNAEIEGRNIPAGIYILKEIKAPEGYSKSNVEWTVEISKDGITVKLDNRELSKLTEDELKKINDSSIDENGAYFYYDNEILYELPSAGGPGIFWYTIGGILLMIAATLILYKNKCREVLNR